MSESVFNIENEAVILQLFNKSKHNNTINVVTETTEQVSAPFYDNDKKEWVVPSEVVGLDSKKSKNIKMRFHPSVVELSANNDDIHSAACVSSIKYLDTLLEDSEWSRHGDEDDHLFDFQLNRLSSLLFEVDKIVEFNKDRMIFTFLQNERFEELLKIISCKSVSNHLITNIADGADHQVAEISFIKNGGRVKRPILSVTVDSDYLECSQSGSLCTFDVSNSCVSWVLKRVEENVENSPSKVPQILDCSIFVDKIKHEAPIFSPCYTINDLSEKLSISLVGVPNQLGSLTKLPQNMAADTIIALDKNEAAPLSKLIYSMTADPLIINCDVDPKLMCLSESETAWSPTESIDSGFSVSPTRGFEDPFYTPPLRERSFSECHDFHGHRIKGILKWPKIHRFSVRSYSECADDVSGFSSSNLFISSPPFFEDEEDIFQEDDSDHSPPAPRKKSVSFSEKLFEQRLFNSNSCIEAQKRKTQKKNEKKKKRELSSGDSVEESGDEPSLVGSNRHQTV